MFDTADVYGDGRSERCIAEFLTAHAGLDTFMATKMGRRADQTLRNYGPAHPCDRYRGRVDSRTTSRVGRGVSAVAGSSSSRARRTFCIIISPSAAKSCRTVVRGG